MSAIEILILAGLMCTDGLENHSVEEMFRVSCPSTLAVEVTAFSRLLLVSQPSIRKGEGRTASKSSVGNAATRNRDKTSRTRPFQAKLELNGDWEGSWRHAQGRLMPAGVSSLEGNDIIGIMDGGYIFIRIASIRDEGSGRFRIAMGQGFLGIYKQKGDRVVLCFRQAREGYPTLLRGGDGQHLIRLRRVKPP